MTRSQGGDNGNQKAFTFIRDLVGSSQLELAKSFLVVDTASGPFFPNSEGGAPAKVAVQATIVQAA